MATLSGGKRDRMIKESMWQAVQGHLTTEGWFAGGREHSAIVLTDEYPDDNSTDVAPNTLAFSVGISGGEPAWLGDRTEDHYLTYFCDFFAEDDSVGLHLAGDIYEFLKSVDTLPVYDYSDVGDPEEFRVEVEDDIEKRKPANATNAWQKHWFTVSFTVRDSRPH